MNILLIGQCSLHWGRMEFGNIGNYYIIEPFIRELHQTFPAAKIKMFACWDNRVQVKAHLQTSILKAQDLARFNFKTFKQVCSK